MATSKKTGKVPSRSAGSTAKPRNSDSVRSRSAPDADLHTNDVGAEQGSAIDDIVAAVPFNATKEFEYGHETRSHRGRVSIPGLYHNR